MKDKKSNTKQTLVLLLLLTALFLVFSNCTGPADPNDGSGDLIDDPTADYRISGVTLPTTDSHDYSGSFTITNDGDATGTETISWAVYRSSNSTYDAGDALIGQGTLAALGSGATSSSISFSGSYPLANGSSTYYFIIQVSAVDDTELSGNEYASSPITFTILLYESFENAYDNAWTINDTFYTLSFDELSSLPGGLQSPGSMYALQQTSATAGGHPWNDTQKLLFSSDITPSYIRYYVRAGQIDKDGGQLTLLGPNPYPSKIYILFRDTPSFETLGSLITNHGPYSVDTWYMIEIKDIDYTNNTFDVYIDGDLDYDDKLVISGFSAFGGIILYNADDGQFFYDDILIY